MNKFLILIIILCSFPTVSCNSSNSSTKKEIKTNPEKGKETLAPDFTLEDLEGNKHTLSKYKGKVVIINFWAIHCPACRKEILFLKNLYKEYIEEKNENLVILGIGIGKKSNLKFFSDFIKINYPILICDIETARKYRVQAVPVTIIINKKGEIINTRMGFSESFGEKIKIIVKELLKEEEEKESEK
ncbi:MAG: TlpA disulfide reductase family protein [candidate division WOR-3 bacterium]